MIEVRKHITDYLDLIRTDAIPHLSTATAAFTYEDGKIKILLIELAGLENLLRIPERAVFKQESIECSARQSLSQYCGLNKFNLEQFHTFDISETERSTALEIFQSVSDLLPPEYLDLLKQRSIIVGHYAFVNQDDRKTTFEFPIKNAQWYDIHSLDDLIQEPFQKEIIQKAYESLRQRIIFSPIIKHFLPEVFTLAEMQKLVETISNRELDRGNFRKQVLKSGHLIQMGKKPSSCHRSPYLYKFMTVPE